MIRPSQEEFEALTTRGNLIPVVREILADLDTPLSTYLKLVRTQKESHYSYLLESSQGGEKWGRYSIIGLPAKTILTVRGNDIQVRYKGELTETAQHDDPLVFVEQYQKRFKVAPVEGLPRFYGGLVGYFAYDTVTHGPLIGLTIKY